MVMIRQTPHRPSPPKSHLYPSLLSLRHPRRRRAFLKMPNLYTSLPSRMCGLRVTARLYPPIASCRAQPLTRDSELVIADAGLLESIAKPRRTAPRPPFEKLAPAPSSESTAATVGVPAPTDRCALPILPEVTRY